MTDLTGVDLETVTFMGSYRVGFLPPLAGSLAAGELFVELSDPAATPRLWIGMMKDNVPGDAVVLMGDPAEPRVPLVPPPVEETPPPEEPPPEPEPEPDPPAARRRFNRG